MEAQIDDKTRAIFCESIANPGGIVVDIEAIAKIAQKANIPLIVDNTLATPYLCRPFEFGADIVVHSATKFLGGHGNSIGGLLVDGGKFNWAGDARYPMISGPRPEYQGIVMAETFGNFAFAIACRVLGLRDLEPVRLGRHQTGADQLLDPGVAVADLLNILAQSQGADPD